MTRLVSLALFFSFALALVGCQSYEKSSDGKTRSSSNISSPTSPTTPTAPPTGPVPPIPVTSCASRADALAIVRCNRSRWGSSMSSIEILAFLKDLTRDLNTARIVGGPFGILNKSGGSNCGGYSCDVICAGNGAAQAQWDVLTDSEGSATPTWSRITSIRRDQCTTQ